MRMNIEHKMKSHPLCPTIPCMLSKISAAPSVEAAAARISNPIEEDKILLCVQLCQLLIWHGLIY